MIELLQTCARTCGKDEDEEDEYEACDEEENGPEEEDDDHEIALSPEMWTLERIIAPVHDFILLDPEDGVWDLVLADVQLGRINSFNAGLALFMRKEKGQLAIPVKHREALAMFLSLFLGWVVESGSYDSAMGDSDEEYDVPFSLASEAVAALLWRGCFLPSELLFKTGLFEVLQSVSACPVCAIEEGVSAVFASAVTSSEQPLEVLQVMWPLSVSYNSSFTTPPAQVSSLEFLVAVVRCVECLSEQQMRELVTAAEVAILQKKRKKDPPELLSLSLRLLRVTLMRFAQVFGWLGETLERVCALSQERNPKLVVKIYKLFEVIFASEEIVNLPTFTLDVFPFDDLVRNVTSLDKAVREKSVSLLECAVSGGPRFVGALLANGLGDLVAPGGLSWEMQEGLMHVVEIALRTGSVEQLAAIAESGLFARLLWAASEAGDHQSLRELLLQLSSAARRLSEAGWLGLAEFVEKVDEKVRPLHLDGWAHLKAVE
jgi:hypothetical protein